MQSNNTGFVYVLTNPAWHDQGQSILKIGCTKRDPHHRVRELSQGNLDPCQLVHSICVPDPVEVEKTLHSYFQSKKHRGEFYRVTENEVVKVMGLFRTTTPKKDQVTVTKSGKKGRNTKENKTSQYHGVDFHRSSKKWRARVTINKSQHFVGLFDTEEQAHIAREHYLAIY